MRTIAAFLLASTATLAADEWPRWMGTEADGIWHEPGVRTDLETEAPATWRVPVGWGYSGPAVAGGKVYLPDYQRTSGELINNPGKAVVWEGTERLLCLDAATGETKWIHETERRYKLSYPGGPRATPTVAGGLVYFLGGMGHLTVFDAETGELRWEKDFQKEFGAPLPIWGFSAHPLVEDGVLYCLVGGEGSIAAAFDAKTGHLKWKALDGESQGYCPPSIISAGGTDQLIIWHPASINGLDPATGKTYWSLPLKPNYGMSVSTPRFAGNRLFASGIGNIGAMIELGTSKPTAEIAWRGKPKTALYTCNSTPLLIGGVLYGNDIRSNSIIAASLETGERYWKDAQAVTGGKDFRGGSHGTAFLAYHEPSSRFWITNEAGDLIVAKLDQDGYEEIGRQHVLEPTNEAFGRRVVWSSPAFAHKAVFMRNDKELVRIDLSE